MKKLYIILLVMILGNTLKAQTLYNNGGTIYINTNAKVYVSGSLTNAANSTISNNGTLEVTGNTTNNSALSSPAGSTIHYEGTTVLTISGTQPVSAQNVIVNNAAGIILNTPLQVSGTLTFTNGIIDASNYSVVLGSAATVSGVSNASHVKGYVVKEGTGSFTYPVGDGTKYQKVSVNATASATGIKVRYQAADAGTGTFAINGTEAIALDDYNSQEYWDITPNSTATAAITLFWDGYKDTNAATLTNRRIAHKTGGNWLNEGGTAAGTVITGSITSNSVSTFSPFTFGSIPTVLPVSLTNFTAKADGNRAKLEWITASEQNNSHFLVERSIDGNNFVQIGKVNGNGTIGTANHYKIYDYQPANGINYYRLKQVDANGKTTELDTKPLNFSLLVLNLSAYPNPSAANFTVVSSVAEEAIISNISGQIVKRMQLIAGTNTIDAVSWPTGIYVLKTASSNLKLVKN